MLRQEVAPTLSAASALSFVIEICPGRRVITLKIRAIRGRFLAVLRFSLYALRQRNRISGLS
jgi:hypothetical protein